MVRVKRGNVARKRRKKILKLASGFKGAHSKLFRVANQQVNKSLRYSYVGRKLKKRRFRRLWILRLNAASREEGLNYSKLVNSLKLLRIQLNRKSLSQLAMIDNDAFKRLVASSRV
uniref:Large ribosomal subunit protein bL20c n=1 Tax=Cyanidium caldarium TaxID=2771 RepID=RK20_CYACA|nr:ribosomal protein L20 [Cyanidium caldarium]Q9TLS0.1 RecName: Full=Large ribosomal subunit protein bL20c; AltName: Full=50S ribosomal protein L20, chloroplastic [Cyanidium caldarium]AAF12895.1 unknown [Cyanidium caldarium]WDB00134.1 ribosomal protein L20 [Cyanidium caldarium]